MRYMTKSERFFNEEEMLRIKEITRSVELQTIGEVAVMVVDSSDRYIEAELTGAIIFGSLFSLIITTIFFYSSMWVYIPLSFILFFLLWFIFYAIPVLKTPFISFKRKEQEVMERAIRAFYEKGLYRTRKNTGVLFFLSLLEHKVWVLADKGIYEKIDQETLNRFANTVSQGIKDGRASEVLCSVIKEAGDLLARHFPITHGDIDELSNEVMTE